MHADGDRRRFRATRLAAALLTLALGGCFAPDPVREPPRTQHRVVSGRPASGPSRPSYGETYVVARGDTLYSIAFRNQLDYRELADWNGIGRDYAIKVGQVLRLTPPQPLRLPADGSAPAAAAQGRGAGSSAASSASAGPGPGRIAGSTSPRAGTGAGAVSSALSAAGDGGWEWPTRGKLLRGFDGSGNKGLDVGGDPGQLVVASRGGRVVYSGSALKGYGELIIIKHDDDYLSAYGYNRRRLVEEGETVAAGQPIAELGIGPEQRPLLHFEIRERGRPVDPKPLLPAR